MSISFLTHNLILLTKYNNQTRDYICTKCAIELFHSNNNVFFIIKNNGSSIENDCCSLTCNEYIIKSIIE